MNGYQRLTDGLNRAQTNVRDTFNRFESNKYVSGTKDFLNSNSIVAKVAFLILVVILFVLFLRLGTSLLSMFLSPSRNPKLVDGMKEGHTAKVIPQDPNASGSVPILRSVNKQDGLEFTYSIWLNIERFHRNNKYKHIFHKGNDGFAQNPSQDGLNQPNNAPGLYLDKNNNNVVILMNTFNNINEKVVVKDVPLNKWICLVIRVEGRKMDVYINGSIVLRHEFTSVPKQNYGDVYVNMNGGFDGLLSDLWYHDYALNVNEILKISEKGPNMKMSKSLEVYPPYFSLRWYFQQ